MFPDLSHRVREAEWMDAPDADPGELRRSLLFIRRINALLGYTRQTISHLERFSRGWRRGEQISIIDFATGSADVPRAVLRWADRRGWDLRIVGVDLHAATVAAARSESTDSRLSIVRADVLDLPFADGSFDYALTSMFLHHLDDDAVVKVLSEMNRVSRRGMIAADLLRCRRAYVWISLFTIAAGPMVRHDARVSVAQSFTREEAIELGNRAGVDFAAYHRHFGHRFSLAGERRG